MLKEIKYSNAEQIVPLLLKEPIRNETMRSLFGIQHQDVEKVVRNVYNEHPNPALILENMRYFSTITLDYDAFMLPNIDKVLENDPSYISSFAIMDNDNVELIVLFLKKWHPICIVVGCGCEWFQFLNAVCTSTSLLKHMAPLISLETSRKYSSWLIKFYAWQESHIRSCYFDSENSRQKAEALFLYVEFNCLSNLASI